MLNRNYFYVYSSFRFHLLSSFSSSSKAFTSTTIFTYTVYSMVIASFVFIRIHFCAEKKLFSCPHCSYKAIEQARVNQHVETRHSHDGEFHHFFTSFL